MRSKGIKVLSATLLSIIYGLLLAFFTFGALVNLAGPKKLVDDFARWGYPRNFHIITGVAEALVIVLLAVPSTRWAGLTLGLAIMLAAAITLIIHREFAHSAPAFVIIGLIALAAWP